MLHQENVIAGKLYFFNITNKYFSAANLARQAVSDLLSTVKAASQNADNADLKYRILNSGREVALQIKHLLANLLQLHSRPDHPATKQAILIAAREIAKVHIEI